MSQTPSPPAASQAGSPMSLETESPMSGHRFNSVAAGLSVLGQGLEYDEQVAASFTGETLGQSQQILQDLLRERGGGTPRIAHRSSLPPEISPRIATPSPFLLDGDQTVSATLEALDAAFDLVPPLRPPVSEPQPAIAESVESTIAFGAMTFPIQTPPPVSAISTTAFATPHVPVVPTREATPVVNLESENFDDVDEDIPGSEAVTGENDEILTATTNADIGETIHATIGEVAAAELIEDPSPLLPPGYPPLDDVFASDPVRASHLFSSGLIQHLQCVRAEDIKNCGVKIVKIAEGHTVKLTGYDQVLFALACKYYGPLPNVEFCPDTHQVLHLTNHYQRSSRGRRESPSQELQRCYTTLTAEGLEHLASLLARMILPESALKAGSFLETMSVANCKKIMSELRRQFPQALVVYRMFYQLMHGGLECISPIPELLRFNDDMSVYLNNMAKGTSWIQSHTIACMARESKLPVHIPETSSTARITPLTTTAAETTAIAARPVAVGYGDAIRSTAAPTTFIAPPVMSTVTTVVTTNIGAGPSSGPAYTTAAAPPSSSVRPAIPATTQVAPLGSSRQGYVNDLSQLMGQAAPRGTPVNRDTAAFRASVENQAGILSAINLLTEAVTSVTVDNTVIKEMIQDLGRRMAALETAFASAQVISAAQDLNARINLNRTVLVPQEQAAAQAVQSALPMGAPDQAQSRTYMQKLRMENCMALYPEITEEIRQMLLSAGHVNVASVVTPASMKCPNFRKRLAARLQTL